MLGLLDKECRNPANWKGQRQLQDAALVVAADDPEAALGLTRSLDMGRKLRTIERIEARSAGLGPWPFFEIREQDRTS